MLSTDGDDDSNSNTLRILIATDNHLGFEEKDAVRKEDSFLAFEEILRTARERYVSYLYGDQETHQDESMHYKCNSDLYILVLHELIHRCSS